MQEKPKAYKYLDAMKAFCGVQAETSGVNCFIVKGPLREDLFKIKSLAGLFLRKDGGYDLAIGQPSQTGDFETIKQCNNILGLEIDKRVMELKAPDDNKAFAENIRTCSRNGYPVVCLAFGEFKDHVEAVALYSVPGISPIRSLELLKIQARNLVINQN